MQWTETSHTKTWSRRSFATLRAVNGSCIGVNPILSLQLWKSFLLKNSTNLKMMRNLITVSGALWIEQYWQPLQTLTKNTKRLWLMLLMIYKTFLHHRAKNCQLLIEGKFEATVGVKNTTSYIPWLYTTWDLMVASNMIHCVSVLMKTTITQDFVWISNNACL